MRTPTAGGIALAMLAAFAGARVPTAAAAPAAALPAEVTEAFAGLRGLGFDVASPAVSETLLEALVRAVDPGGRLLPKDGEVVFCKRRAGFEPRIGVDLTVTDGQIVIARVEHDSPAAKAGLKTGERIEEVDGVYVREESPEAALLRLSGGEPDSVVTLLAGAEGQPARTVEVARAWFKADAILDAEDFPRKLAYLRLGGLYAGSGATVRDRLNTWNTASCDGVILDLRGANGEDAASVADLANLLAGRPGESLFRLEDRTGAPDYAAPAIEAPPPAFHPPLMVLIDGLTTGAAELLAAVLAREGRRVMLIGQPTSGDPCLRKVVPLGDGRTAFLAARRLVYRDGTAFDTAVKPYIKVKADGRRDAVYEPETLERSHARVLDEELEDQALRRRVNGDPALQRAADLLLGLKALAQKPGAHENETP